MALKRKVEDLTTVEEAYRPLYTEKKVADKVVYLLTEIEGWDAPDILRTKNSENGTLRVENTKYKAQLAAFEGIDIEQAANAINELTATKEELEALKAGKPADAKAVDKIVEAKVKAAITPFENKLKKASEDLLKATNERDQLKTSITLRSVDDVAIGAFRSLKVDDDVFSLKGDDPEDVPDGLLWARQRFVVNEEGKVVCKKTGLAPKDVLEQMKDAGQRGHWFGTTGGTGSETPGTGGKTASNPWLPGAAWNTYQQSLIQGKDPARAQALATAAGCPDMDAAFHPKDGAPKDLDRY